MSAPEPDDLRALGAKLEKIRGENLSRRDAPEFGGIAIAFRLITEMIAAVVVALGLGWFLDWVFGVRLVFLLVMLGLGMAAGVRNAIHAANEMNKKIVSQSGSSGDKES